MLISSRLLTDRGLVQELVADVNQLPSFTTGAVACPKDDRSQILALLAYSHGPPVMVSVDLGGCETVSNGAVERTAMGFGSPGQFGPQLVARLKNLVGPAPASKTVGATALARSRWSVLARSPLGTRHGPEFVWDGRELLELGGTAAGRLGGAPADNGAAYDPVRKRWRRVASAPAVVMPAGAAAVWTGRQVFVFGGPTLPNERATDVAGLYNPATNRWTVTSKAPVGPFNAPTAVWTGTRVILAGITRGYPRLEVASYDPATDIWTSLQPPISLQHPPLTMAMVATNEGVLLWSLWGRTRRTATNTYTGYSGVDVFRIEPSGTWMNVTDSWPQNKTVDDPVFAGTKILLAPGQIWCGLCSHPAPMNEHGYTVDPATLRLTPIPHGPLDDLGPQIIWTGAAEMSFNPAGEIIGPHVRVRPGDIAIWNPATRKWSRGRRAPLQSDNSPAVWSGSRLYVLAHNGKLLSYGP